MPSPSPGESQAPKIKSGSVTDALNGISIPIPKGWTGQELSVGVQNLFDDRHPEFGGQFVVQSSEFPRAVYGQLAIKF